MFSRGGPPFQADGSRSGPPFYTGSWWFQEVGHHFIFKADEFKRWATFWKLMFSTGGPFFKLIISRGGPPFTFKADNFQRWEPLLHWKLIFSRGRPPFQAHYFQRWGPSFILEPDVFKNWANLSSWLFPEVDPLPLLYSHLLEQLLWVSRYVSTKNFPLKPGIFFMLWLEISFKHYAL